MLVRLDIAGTLLPDIRLASTVVVPFVWFTLLLLLLAWLVLALYVGGSPAAAVPSIGMLQLADEPLLTSDCRNEDDLAEKAAAM